MHTLPSKHSRRVGVACAIVVMLCALTTSAASADVRALNATTGQPDPAFVTLDATTRPIDVVSDGAHGAYLLGHIVVAGVDRQIAHMLPNGRLDPSFHVTFGGGAVRGAALRNGELALLGSFSSVDSHPRRQVAIVDARTGALRSWAPLLPAALAARRPGQIAFTPSSLVASVAGAVVAWQTGHQHAHWSTSSVGWSQQDQVPYVPPMATTGSSIWAVVDVKGRGMILARLDPASGRVLVANPDARAVDWLQTIGGDLYESYQGTYFRVASTKLVPRCGNTAETTPSATDTDTYVNAIAGDDRTVYAAVEAIDADGPTKHVAISACDVSIASMPALERFHGPVVASNGPSISSMALVGDDLLVFTR